MECFEQHLMSGTDHLIQMCETFNGLITCWKSGMSKWAFLGHVVHFCLGSVVRPSLRAQNDQESPLN